MRNKVLVVLSIVVIAALGLYLADLYLSDCKKVQQTYEIGTERCCKGLDFAPTSDPNRNICLPKTAPGVEY